MLHSVCILHPLNCKWAKYGTGNMCCYKRQHNQPNQEWHRHFFSFTFSWCRNLVKRQVTEAKRSLGKKKLSKQPPNSSPLPLPMGNTHPFKYQIEEEAIIVRRSSRLATLEKARDLQEQHHWDFSGKAPNNPARVSLHYQSKSNIHTISYRKHKFYLLPPKHFKIKISIPALIIP